MCSQAGHFCHRLSCVVFLLTAARIFGRTKLVNQLTKAELVKCCAPEIVSNGEPLQYHSHPLRGRRRAVALLRECAAIALRRAPRLEQRQGLRQERGKCSARPSGPPLAESG